MKLYDEEWKAFQAYQEAEGSEFPTLTQKQKDDLLAYSRELKDWQRENPTVHNLLTLAVVLVNVSLIAVLGFVVPAAVDLGPLAQVFLSVAYGLAAYGLTVYSLHELNGHNQGFRGRGALVRAGNFVALNLCRIFHADPEFYKTQHYSHHSLVATREDRAFTNAISLRRFLVSIIPFSVATPFCDYKIHTSDEWSRSKAASELVSLGLLLSICANLYVHQGPANVLIFAAVAPWASFFFDRLRETSEHNFMPGQRGNEARSFGLTFWGLVVGGGPWGQCCHLAHHLAPSLPWYLQLRLQRRLERTLDERQKKVFLRGGFVDYLVLWKEIFSKQKIYFSQS